MQTTMSDHFTISAQASHNLANKQHDTSYAEVRNFKYRKEEKH